MVEGCTGVTDSMVTFLMHSLCSHRPSWLGRERDGRQRAVWSLPPSADKAVETATVASRLFPQLPWFQSCRDIFPSRLHGQRSRCPPSIHSTTAPKKHFFFNGRVFFEAFFPKFRSESTFSCQTHCPRDLIILWKGSLSPRPTSTSPKTYLFAQRLTSRWQKNCQHLASCCWKGASAIASPGRHLQAFQRELVRASCTGFSFFARGKISEE